MLYSSERLIFSNRLIELYEDKKNVVVEALINSILEPSNSKSYRVNLYIVFTFARISGGWEGSNEQLEKIKSLRETQNYKDDTFRKRVDEAISNFKKQ